ncbi:hypothetical protein KBD08_04250, partial [Candidatus Babeliales bacterium]|nr:hypothetical protein [Candidatus Babeliales bacterium]
MFNNFLGRWLLVALLVHHGVHAVPKPKDGTGVDGAVSQVVAPIDKAAKEQARLQKLEDMRAEAYDPRTEKVVNLCICNDYSEICPPWATLDVVEQLASEQGAIVQDTLQALLDQQTVVCTKSLWVTIQNVVTIWQRYADQAISEQEILDDYKVNMQQADVKFFENNAVDLLSTISLKKKLALSFRAEKVLEYIRASRAVVSKFDAFYQQEIHHQMDMIKQQLKNNDSKSGIINLFNGINNLLQDRFEKEELDNYKAFFNFYLMYQIIMQYNYECRSVDENYFVFYDAGDAQLINMFKHLGKYAYREYLSREQIDEVYEKALGSDFNQVSGKLLSLALYRLTRNLDSNILQQPFFNIVLTGHGMLHESVAGLSVRQDIITKRVLSKPIWTEKIVNGQKRSVFDFSKQQQPQEVELLTSDFAQFLEFLNDRMRTKTLTISSCYAAGQQYEGTPLTMQQQFNSSVLENIKYPIIFIGSFATTTLGFRLVIDEMFRFNKYFSLLNEYPAQYKKATELFFLSNEGFLTHNLASIKMPNTSWLTLTSSIKDTVDQDGGNQMRSLIITQNKVLDGKVVTIPLVSGQKSVDVIWLQANYMPKIVMPGYDSKQFIQQQYFDELFKKYAVFPSFLPVQRYNQNYVIDVIECKDLEIFADGQDKVTFKDVMQHFFDVQGIQEPINIVIKNFVFKNVTYKNVYIFMYKAFETKRVFRDSLESIQDGYVYT